MSVRQQVMLDLEKECKRLVQAALDNLQCVVVSVQEIRDRLDILDCTATGEGQAEQEISDRLHVLEDLADRMDWALRTNRRRK